MAAERGGHHFPSSVALTDGQIGQAAYSSSKGGIVGMNVHISAELAAVRLSVWLDDRTRTVPERAGPLLGAFARRRRRTALRSANSVSRTCFGGLADE